MSIVKKIKSKYRYYQRRLFKRIYTNKLRETVGNNQSPKTIYYFCAPIHPNLGDQAQAMCIHKWFSEEYPDYKVIALPKQLTTDEIFESVKAKIRPEDKVFIHSGYLFTDMYEYLPFIRRIVETFVANPIVVLPQTINIASQKEIGALSKAVNAHPDLTLMCRDDVSYGKAQEIFSCKLLLYPDFVTSLVGRRHYPESGRDGVLFIIRDDKEKLYADSAIDGIIADLRAKGIRADKMDTTIDVSPFSLAKKRDDIIEDCLKKIAKYQAVVTDRFHGTIFSQVASTPAIVMASNDHKLQSGVKWFNVGDFKGRIFYSENLTETESLIGEILQAFESRPVQSNYFYETYWSKLHKTLEP